ncbi:PAX3- and PAX7-binding protein 1-like [Procambarus clarkii]|uniref:PAX3- and PAX7-binding protein 1-like n=1 Tax=Procambarus clarkii TaxID=6728 RepID=UPI003743A801
MFKKRKNINIRQRRLSEDEAGAESDAMAIASNDDSNSNFAIAIKKEKKKKEKVEPKKQSILSFEDDLTADDGIIFQEKKSSLSYKLRKEMKKEKKEKRREEKEKQRQAEGKDKFRDKDKNGGPTVSELDELGIRIVNGREAESIGAKPGDSDEDDPNTPGKHKFRSKSTRTSHSLDPWKKILQSGQIPDANMIHAIRKQRQQAREQGDMVPLDDTVRVEETKSRLVRDDDNDRSDDDGESRMDFSVNQQARDRQQRQEAFEAAQAEGGSDNSDHEREWEKQQLLKAGANPKVVVGCDGEFNLEIGDPNAIQFTVLDNGTAQGTQDQRLWGTETLIPSSAASLPRPSNYQAEGIIKRLQDR